MNVKAFRRADEHARAGPLFRPKSDLCWNAVVLSNKFAKTASVQLRKNLSRKNFHARDPDSLHVGLASVNSRYFAGFDSRTPEPLGERASFIIANSQRVSRWLVQTNPQIFPVHVNVDVVKRPICLTVNRRVREQDFCCTMDCAVTNDPVSDD